MDLLRSLAPNPLIINKVIDGVGELHIRINYTCAQMLLGSGYDLELRLDNGSTADGFDYWLWYFIDTYLEQFDDAAAINDMIARVQDKRDPDDLEEELANLLVEGFNDVRIP